MLETILMVVHGALLLFFGIYLSAAFSQLRLDKHNISILFDMCIFSGVLQIVSYLLFGEARVWKLYPVITHAPLIAFLCCFYHKRFSTALAAVCSAYLCCQPAKWFGLLIFSLTGSAIAEYIARMCVLVIVGFLVLRYFAPSLAALFTKTPVNVWIFGAIPIIYYLFDYATVVYTDLWLNNNRLVAEFLPFSFCIIFLLFCVIYYKGYEEKADLERKEQIIRITIEQQARELEAFKRNDQEIRLLRHDMRLILDSVAVSLRNGDTQTALELVDSCSSRTKGVQLQRFCADNTINYILSDFSEKCLEKQINFIHTIQISELNVDETLFTSILSNALDNALNAQAELPPAQRCIRLMLKTMDGKLLLSVKNPVKTPPVFSDGLPISHRPGHGYGTQSIRYMTERLGGNSQFSMQDNLFVLRVVI